MFPQSMDTAANMFDALIYSESHPNVINYLSNQYNRFADTLTAPARAFMEKGKEVFEHFHNSDAMRYARSVVQKFSGNNEVANTDTIQSIFELERFQNANLTNQRWIMANPVVRKMYCDQTIDGYSSTYFDVEPGAIGVNHYDYRMVMDGMMVVEKDDWKIVQYMDQLKEGDRELMLEEKVDIRHNWDYVEYLITLNKDDPTSADGGML